MAAWARPARPGRVTRVLRALYGTVDRMAPLTGWVLHVPVLPCGPPMQVVKMKPDGEVIWEDGDNRTFKVRRPGQDGRDGAGQDRDTAVASARCYCHATATPLPDATAHCCSPQRLNPTPIYTPTRRSSVPTMA